MKQALTANDMLRILTGLGLHYPQAGRSLETLATLAQDWTEDFEAYPLWAIEKAAKLARRSCRFFPTTCEMLEFCEIAYRDVRGWQDKNALPAPDMTDSENLKRGKKQAEHILEMLAEHDVSGSVII